jgi:hypothetical protein
MILVCSYGSNSPWVPILHSDMVLNLFGLVQYSTVLDMYDSYVQGYVALFLCLRIY